jgi:tyrosine-protein kinase Etk/Wzc
MAELIGSSNLTRSDASAGSPNLEFDQLDLLIGVLKRKKQIALTVGIFGLAAALISFLVPLTYTATTKIMPPQQTQSIANTILGQLGPLAGLAGKDIGSRNPSELFVAILKSQTLEDSLIQEFELMTVYGKKMHEDARKRLESQSDIVATKEGIIAISVSDRDPKRAAAIANGYVEQLYKLNQTLAVTEAAQRRLFFQQELEQEKSSLSDAEVAMERAQEKSGLIQLDSQARASIEENSEIEAEIAATEVQIRSMTSFATPQNPDYVRAQEQLSALQAQLAKNKSKQGPGALELGTRSIPELGLEYVRRMRDVKYHEALYELLMRQYEAARIDEAKSASIIQVLDKALIPERHSAPRRSLYVLIGLLTGTFFALAWVFLSEFIEKASGSADLGPKVRAIKEGLRRERSDETKPHFTAR